MRPQSLLLEALTVGVAEVGMVGWIMLNPFEMSWNDDP